MCQNLLFQPATIKKKCFLTKYILIYFSYSFQAFVWLRGLTLPSSSGMTIYRNRLGQFRTLNILLESFWSHCLVVSVQFLGHSSPSWVSAAPSSGHLDPLTILLSFFRESKAVLASTIIFFEDTSCYTYDAHLTERLVRVWWKNTSQNENWQIYSWSVLFAYVPFMGHKSQVRYYTCFCHWETSDK